MDIGRKTVETLIHEYGSPLYVFDEQGFRKNYRRLEAAMCKLYPNYRISYSFKTNYTPYVCRTAKSLGAWAEVVSGMEYYIARRIGYTDEEILFNGPDKGESGINAFLKDCRINIDSLDELGKYIDAAEQHPERKFKLGLRVNLDLGQSFISRFGLDEKDLPVAFAAVAEVPNLRITGLHCHISRCRDLAAWKMRAKKMLALADRFFEEAPEYIDLGSGMFGSMAPEFAAQFQNVPSYAEYAQVTAGLFADHYRGKKAPLLITEPGTTLINRYVDLISEVKAIKEIRGQCFAILDCSIHNLGEASTLKRLPIQVIPGGAPQREYTEMSFVGYTCLEQDVMYTEYNGALAKGDRIVFGNTGGYSNVLKPPFIRPNCAMVAQREAEDYVLIKAPEEYEDLLHTYVFEEI